MSPRALLRRRAVRALDAALFETLEARRLLTVSYNAGLRLVTSDGNGGNNNIALSTSGSSLVVNENGVNTFFALSSVDHVNVFTTNNNGGVGNDLVVVNSLFRGGTALGVTVDTGPGTDTLRCAETTTSSTFDIGDRTTTWSIVGIGTMQVIFFRVEAEELYGSNDGDTFIANSIGPLLPNLTVHAYGFGSGDLFTVAQPVVNGAGGNVSFTGGSGDDAIVIDASANTGATSLRVVNDYVALNQSGTPRQAHFDTTENVSILGGSGPDFISIDSFSTGAGLTIDGNDGNDLVDWVPTSENLSANITNMSSFFFDGGAGTDTMREFNNNSALQWNYTRTSTIVQAQAPATGYNLTLSHFHVEQIYLSGGSNFDQFFVESAPAGSLTQLDGVGSSGNFYVLGQAAHSTAAIHGLVEVFGASAGEDSIIIDDQSDATGRTVHLDQTTIGAGVGDDLLGAGDGSVSYSGITGVINLRLGSGDDTIFVKPNTASIDIDGKDPTAPAAPGDTLNAAMGTAINPVHNPTTPGNGFINYDNGPGISYESIETVNYDPVSPMSLGVAFEPMFTAQHFSFAFDDDVSASLSAASLVLYNETTATQIPAADITFSYEGNTALFSFDILGGTLADGIYSATLVGVTDPVGNDAVGDLDYRVIWSMGTGGDDEFRTALNPANFSLQVFENDPVTPVFTADPLLIDMIALYGGSGNDRLTQDIPGGFFIPPDGIRFDGGDDIDTLAINGSSAADTVTFDGGDVDLNGRLVIHSNVESRLYDGAGGDDVLTVNDGAVAVATTQQLASLTIGPTASVAMLAGSAATLVTHDLLISPGGVLDLADNDLILHYDGASPIGSWDGAAYTGVTGLLQSGNNGGAWDGSGIVTTMPDATGGNTLTTLAVAEASDVLGISGDETALWNDQPVDAATVLVKYTYSGDANLDGVVNGDDYFQIDSAFPQQLHGWVNGDFNYDGVVNGDDYFMIDSTFPQQGAPL